MSRIMNVGMPDTLELKLNEISNSKLHIQLRHRNVTICIHRSDRSHSMPAISHLVEHDGRHVNLFRPFSIRNEVLEVL